MFRRSRPGSHCTVDWQEADSASLNWAGACLGRQFQGSWLGPGWWMGWCSRVRDGVWWRGAQRLAINLASNAPDTNQRYPFPLPGPVGALAQPRDRQPASDDDSPSQLCYQEWTLHPNRHPRFTFHKISPELPAASVKTTHTQLARSAPTCTIIQSL